MKNIMTNQILIYTPITIVLSGDNMKLIKPNIIIFLVMIIFMFIFVFIHIQKDVNAFQSVHIQKKINTTQNQILLAATLIIQTPDINISKNETKNNLTPFPSGGDGGWSNGHSSNENVIVQKIIKQPSYMDGNKTVDWYPIYMGKQYLNSISETSSPKRGLYPNNSGMTPYTIDLVNFDNYCTFEGKTPKGSYFGASIDDENNTAYVGMRDNYVYAIDMSNCSKKWEYYVGHWVDGIPVQVDDYIIITMGEVWDDSIGTEIIALYKSNGTVKYKYDIGTGYMESVNVWNNLVFAGGYDGGVRTYYADTQRPFWNITIGDGNIYSYVEGGITVDSEGNSYFGTYDEGYAYSITLNGTLKWKTYVNENINTRIPKGSTNTRNNGVSSTPALSKDESMLYVTSNDNRLYSIYTNNGSIKCYYTINDQINAPPTVGYDNDIYFAGGSDPAGVYAVRPDDCSLKWTSQTGQYSNGGVTVTKDGMLLQTSYDGYLRIFNTSDGSIIKQFNMGVPLISTPQVSKSGKVIFTTYAYASRIYIFGLNINTPLLSNITSDSITDTFGFVNFNVNQSDALTQIKYSSDESLSLQTENQTYGTDRSVNITGLNSNTTYNYSVYVYNPINLTHWTNSSIQNFTTNSNYTNSTEVLNVNRR